MPNNLRHILSTLTLALAFDIGNTYFILYLKHNSKPIKEQSEYSAPYPEVSELLLPFYLVKEEEEIISR